MTTASEPRTGLWPCNGQTRLDENLTWNSAMSTELWEKYGHNDSFYGWYLAHEPTDMPCANNYFNPLVDHLRTLASDKVTMIAPAGTPIVSREIVEESKVDAFAYQDAVGPGYMPGVYTYDPYQRINTLDEVFGSYAEIHRGVKKHLWSDLETWQMDGPTYSGAYAAPFCRVADQISIESKYVDVLTAYSYPGFMEDPSSTVRHGGQPAIDLFTDYRDYYQAWEDAREGRSTPVDFQALLDERCPAAAVQ